MRSSLVILLGFAMVARGEFVQFEGRQTHPVRLAEGGRSLFVLNTPDGKLSVFDVSNPGNPRPVLVSEIPVGLEPVSLAQRTADEVWVVNELSDSVSVVSLTREVAVAHLDAGDEPADVVFAGGRAFVTSARENRVLVFDGATRERVGVIELEALFPRAMVVSEDGETVFVAAQMSGNGTTILPPGRAPDPPAPTNAALPPAPKTGVIVADTDGRIGYDVLDHDVAVVDAGTLVVERYLEGAGTVLFDVAVRPGRDEVWVANTEALNLVRFEPVLRGHFVDNRVTRLALDGGGATAFDLNPGIDFGVLPDREAQLSAVAQPTAVVFEADGSALWVAGFGSDLVARVDAETGMVTKRVYVGPELQDGEVARSAQKRGPRGLALDEGTDRLFVLNRISNTVSVVDVVGGDVLGEVAAGSFDPTPARVKAGRGFLYDTRLSGNGTVSCASCHIDADRDGIAWDLGDPGGEMVYIEGENRVIHDPSGGDQDPVREVRALHPMKGPKVTQSMRGMIMDPVVVSDPQVVGGRSTREPLFHWRGDRRTMGEFNATFDKLMGGSEISEADFELLEDYLRATKLHPNPYRNLDRSAPEEIRGGSPSLGRDNFLNHGLSHCAVCHPLPSGTDQNIDEINNASFVDFLKTPALMSSYQKERTFSPGAATSLSGFGFGHDGTGQALPLPHFYFLSVMDTQQLIDTRAYILSFDSVVHGTAPVVGHVVAVDAVNADEVGDVLDMMERRADPTEAELNRYWNDVLVTGVMGGEKIRLGYDAAAGNYAGGGHVWTRAALLAEFGEGDLLNFTGVPAGSASGVLGRDLEAPWLTVANDDGRAVVEWGDAPAGWFPEISGGLGEDGWRVLNAVAERVEGGWRVVLPDGRDGFVRLRRSW